MYKNNQVKAIPKDIISFIESSTEEELVDWFYEKYNENLKHGHVFFAINRCYGGYSLSYEQEIMRKNLRNFIDVDKISSMFPFNIRGDHRYNYEYERYDPYVIVTLKVLGSYYNSKYSDIALEQIKIEDLKFSRIEEYDGMESLCINQHEKLKFDINTIVHSQISSDKKIELISLLIKTENISVIF